MSRQKRKLLILMAIGVLLVALHQALDTPPSSLETWWMEAGWHYWLAMAYWTFVLGYVLLLKCPACRAPQIYRGVSPAEWHWPNDKCWKCGGAIGEAK